MGISIEEKSDGFYVHVDEKSLCRESAEEFKRVVNDIIDSHACDIYIDLSSTEYIDSSGIGKMLFLLNKLKNINKKLVIIAIHQRLSSFFESISLTKVIDIRNEND